MSRPTPQDGCTTLKRGFRTRAKARRYLLSKAAEGHPRAVYLCPRCGSWHLTKQRRKAA